MRKSNNHTKTSFSHSILDERLTDQYDLANLLKRAYAEV